MATKKKVFCTAGNFPRCMPAGNSHMACKLLCNYITTIYRKHAEVAQNHEIGNVRNIGQGEARHSITGLNLAAVKFHVTSWHALTEALHILYKHVENITMYYG